MQEEKFGFREITEKEKYINRKIHEQNQDAKRWERIERGDYK